MNSSCVKVANTPAPSGQGNGTGAPQSLTSSSPVPRAMSASPKQMTIPKNGITTNANLSASSAAAAAADATAMPPPPPTTPGLVRAPVVPAMPTTSSVGRNNANVAVLNSQAMAKQGAVSSVSKTPIAVARAVAPSASAVPSSKNSIGTTTKSALGIPSPLARASVPGEASTVNGGVTIKTSSVDRTAEQRVLAANEAHLAAKKASSLVVPSPVLSIAVRTTAARPTVPQPVLSSAHSTTTAKANAHLLAGQQQRVIPKYLANAPPASAAALASMKRIGVVPKPTINGRLVVPKPNIAKQSVTSSMHAAPHRPATVTSGGIAHVSRHVSQPPPQESISSSSAGGGSSSNGGGGSSSKKKSGHPLRRGKWTTEEEAYANRLINEFKAGLLPLTDGTTLRNFLSKLLNCDPMRISKKFVGNNCIGKQVFRRRVAEINRLTPDQIQQMRVDLSELERRFFDRVAQTNRVKTPGVTAALATGPMTGVPGSAAINIINVSGGKIREELELDRPPTPPWLRPPASYKPKGKFAEKLKAKVVVAPPPPAPPIQKVSVSSTPPLVDVKSNTEKTMEAIQRSHSSLDRLAQAANEQEIPRTESALEQLARTASAAKFVEDIVNGDSSLGETRVEGGKKLSQATLQGSFEALMSMDIQSVENLVELASSSNSSAILSELAKSASSDGGGHKNQSSTNLSSRMESFIKSLSSANLLKQGLDSSAALGSLLNATSSNSLFDAEKFSKRVESSTGFSRLRADGGLANGVHNSVEDFLSLVASGDIPHQDPNMLKVPLQKVMQQTGITSKGSKRKLSQQQLVALANHLSGSSMSLSDLAGASSALKRRKKK